MKSLTWQKELKWINWEVGELTWMTWHEGIEPKELKRMNWHEEIEINEVTWTNRNKWIKTNELKWVNWNDWLEMKDLTRMNWHDWLEMNEWDEMNELRWKNEANELKGMKCQKCPIFLQFVCKIELSLHACTICRPHLQEVVPSCQFFFTIFMWHRALATVLCAFCRPHLRKVARSCQFFYEFDVKSCFLQSRAHFVGHFPGSSRETAETETLQRRPGAATLPEKNKGFCARERFQTWIHTFPLTNPNYLMMIWLTRWCCCHDDWDDDVVAMMVRQLTIDNRP